MTFAEFLALVEEYELPVENPERFRFMIRDMSAEEFRRTLEERETESAWTDTGLGVLKDGRGNTWITSGNWEAPDEES